MKIVVAGAYPVDENRILGGIEAAICSMVEKLRLMEDMEIDVVSCGPYPEGRRCVAKGDNVRIHYVPSSFSHTVGLFVRDVHEVRKEILRCEPDLIHVHGTALYPKAVRGLTIPTVMTVLGIMRNEAKCARGGSVVKRFMRQIIWDTTELVSLRRATNVIVISQHVENNIRNRTRAKLYRVGLPVQDSFFELEDKEVQGRILSVGRTDPRKGFEYLCRAVGMLRERMPNIRLHIVGETGANPSDLRHYGQLQEQVRQNGLSENIVFRGSLDQTELLQEYEECSVFALTSLEESFGIAIAEAMAAGKPVVCSDAGSLPELVRQGDNGLVSAYDDVSGVGNNLEMVLTSAAERQRMGRRGRGYAQQFRSEAIAKAIYEVYKDVLKCNQ